MTATNTMTKPSQRKRSSHKRGGNYKLVFKPAEYSKSLAHFNHNWEEGPLLPWKGNTLPRCYYLINDRKGALYGKVVWAAIYKMNDDPGSLPVAVYTTDNKWNNDVTKKYIEQNLPEYERS